MGGLEPSGDHKDRDFRHHGRGMNRQSKTIPSTRHFYIGEEQIDFQGLQHGDRHIGIVGMVDLVAEIAQKIFSVECEKGFILDNQGNRFVKFRQEVSHSCG